MCRSKGFGFAHALCKLLELASFSLKQIFVFSHLGNHSSFDDCDVSAGFNCSQSVCNNKWSAILHNFVKCILYFALTFLIQCTCCFIKEQNSRVTNYCSRYGQSLLLTPRKFGTSHSCFSVEASVQGGLSFFTFWTFVDCIVVNRKCNSVCFFLVFQF